MIYREITWTFPQQFADTNRIVVGSAYANSGVQNGVGLMEQSQFIAVGSARLLVFGLNSANMTGQATAIGKWSSAPVYPVTLWKRTGGSLTTTTGTSGVTGIYDSGTNSNGSWIRYTDGTMQCWQQGVTYIPVNINLTFAYSSAAQSGSFPQSFISTPAFLHSSGSQGAYGIQWTAMNGAFNTTSFSGIQILAPPASGGVGFGTFNWQAIGKWR
jgi:hypothetical protein